MNESRGILLVQQFSCTDTVFFPFVATNVINILYRMYSGVKNCQRPTVLLYQLSFVTSLFSLHLIEAFSTMHRRIIWVCISETKTVSYKTSKREFYLFVYTVPSRTRKVNAERNQTIKNKEREQYYGFRNFPIFSGNHSRRASILYIHKHTRIELYEGSEQCLTTALF